MAEVLNLGLGAGTNSSEVFNLNTPNPFAISQDYMNKAIAMREKSLARDVANEKERQERLDDFLSKVDNVDPKWANANLELNNLINSYGDQIAEYRAQGRPLTKEFYKGINEAQRAIKNRASINEKNFTKYSQIMAEMSAHPELYSREDIDAFEAQVSGAYEKEDGGIEAAEPILNSWQKKIGPINVVDSYVEGNFLPQSKDKTGYLKATDEKEFKSSVNSYWNSLTMPEKKKIYEQYVRDGRIDADKTLGVEGTEDQKEMIRLIEEDVRPKMEYDKTPVSYSGRGGGSTEKSPFNINAAPVAGFPKDEMRTISLSNPKGGAVEPRLFKTRKSGPRNMIPSYMEYLNKEQAGENPAGWYIFGKEAKEPSSKEIKPGESEEFVIDAYQKENKLNSDEFEYKKEGNKITFYKLVDAIAPYDLNIAEMKGYGVESLEAVAAQEKYKKIAGVSGGWNPNGN